MEIVLWNAGAECMSEDECIANGINFSAYERGVKDAIDACQARIALANDSEKDIGNTDNNFSTTDEALYLIEISMTANGFEYHEADWGSSVSPDYVGKILMENDRYVAQKTNQDMATIHEKARLDRAPNVGDKVTITYKDGHGEVANKIQLMPTYCIGQQFEFKPGDQIVGNGYRGTVQERYSGEVGQPGGMVNVRLPGGPVCISASFPDCYPAVCNEVEVVTEGRYFGKVEEVSNQFVTQNVGRGKLVAHEVGKLDVIPRIGEEVDVQYKFDRAMVMGKDKGVALAR